MHKLDGQTHDLPLCKSYKYLYIRITPSTPMALLSNNINKSLIQLGDQWHYSHRKKNGCKLSKELPKASEDTAKCQHRISDLGRNRRKHAYTLY